MIVFVVLFVVLNYFLDLLFKIPSKPSEEVMLDVSGCF